jgi:shikimate kinase
MKVFLVGPMGTGKSTTGRHLSEKLDYDFYDTDKLVEKAEGRKIKDIFEQNGEDYFRQKESKALSETKTLQNAVIATGGGMKVVLDVMQMFQLDQKVKKSLEQELKLKT